MPILTLTSLQLPAASSVDEKTFLRIAASLAAHWDNPMARSILQAARAGKTPLWPVENFRGFSGSGAGGLVKGKAVILGTARFLAESRVEISERLSKAAQEWQSRGGSVLFCGWEGSARGILRFSENEKTAD